MNEQYEIRARKSRLTLAQAYALGEQLAALGCVGQIQRVVKWPRRRITIDQIGGTR